MSRARLRKALATRDPRDPAVVPLVEAHAAKLEQIAEARWRADAEAQARMHRSVQALYGLDAVTIAAGAGLQPTGTALACDVIRRLRPVLGERAGIAVVLPDAPGETLTEILQAVGAEEPELFLLPTDAERVDPTIEGLAEFYGAALVAIGASATAGVVAVQPADFIADADPPRGWLYSTRTELDPAADPQAVRAAITRLRARHGG